jgi:hypothetical protein
VFCHLPSEWRTEEALKLLPARHSLTCVYPGGSSCILSSDQSFRTETTESLAVWRQIEPRSWFEVCVHYFCSLMRIFMPHLFRLTSGDIRFTSILFLPFHLVLPFISQIVLCYWPRPHPTLFTSHPSNSWVLPTLCVGGCWIRIMALRLIMLTGGFSWFSSALRANAITVSASSHIILFHSVITIRRRGPVIWTAERALT